MPGLLISLAGCAGRVEPAVEPFSLRLERGPCARDCVAYTLTINSDRSVRYERAPMENQGRRSGRAQLSADDLELLKTAIGNSAFFSSNDPVCSDLQEDRGRVELSIHYQGNTRVSSREGGCVSPSPDPVIVLALLVDDLTGSGQWTGAAAARD